MQNINQIKKAVFPVAGLGTRFLPATKAQPKEMLPVVDKPLIQYAVEEAMSADINTMIFVTGRNKSVIENHFDTNYELELELAKKEKQELLQIVRDISKNKINLIYTRQREVKGLGHAVLCAKEIVQNEPFAVLLADDLVYNDKEGVTAQMVKMYQKTQKSIIAIEEIARENVSSYGIIATDDMKDNLMRLRDIVEKPSVTSAPSNLAVIGRYVLTPNIFSFLENTKKGTGGEIQLTDAIAMMLLKDQVYGFKFSGKRYDCGSKLGFLKANIEYGMRHPEVKRELSDYINNI
jgi:UTP--glucose-1-phosphate uridylyltransferase